MVNKAGVSEINSGEFAPNGHAILTAVAPTASLCLTCRHYEIRHFIMAGTPSSGPGCWHHIVAFPTARSCDRYEREPGSDDHLGAVIPNPARN